MIKQGYEFVAGLEMHVQLNTSTKAFCSDNNAFGGDPNTLVSPVSLAHPGTLPVVNLSQIKSAIKLGIALGSHISDQVIFDRKNYFYPDLPKGYQLTQDTLPICIGGSIYLPKTKKSIQIHHIHMEEDAGKLTHDNHDTYSLVDLNRAGVPLLEMVTEPDFRSPDQVFEFIEVMQKLVTFLDISDGNMEEGSIRCDCNVSVRPVGSNTYGERCEIKNINSKRFAKIAVEYEFKRQLKLIAYGEHIKQQTLHFDKQRKITYPLRTKEDAHDYRYFPDPDLPVYHVTNEMVQEIEKSLTELPWKIESRLLERFPLNAVEAQTIAYNSNLTQLFERLAEQITPNLYKTLIDVFFQKLIKLEDYTKPPKEDQLLEFLELVGSKQVNKFHAYEQLFDLMISNPSKSVIQLAQELGILQSDDLDYTGTVVNQVLEQFPQEVQRYRQGQKKLMGFFIGQVMQISKGKVQAQNAQKVLLEILKSD